MTKLAEMTGPAAERVMVGRDRENASVVRLNDTKGKTRIKLFVDATGSPKLDFMDEAGKVIYSVPQGSEPVKK